VLASSKPHGEGFRDEALLGHTIPSLSYVLLFDYNIGILVGASQGKH
jgi:hypothetical protein